MLVPVDGHELLEYVGRRHYESACKSNPGQYLLMKNFAFYSKDSR